MVRTRKREMLGIVLLALTVSTIVTIFVVGERAEEMVEIVQNSHPAQIRGNSFNNFGFTVIARKPLEHLELGWMCLHRIPLEMLDIEEGSTERETMAKIEPTRSLDKMMRLGETGTIEYEVDVEVDGEARRLLVLDYTPILEGLAPDGILANYYGGGPITVIAGVFDKTGLRALYAGFRDLFPVRNDTISELTISKNDDQKVYRRSKDRPDLVPGEGILTVPEGPSMGVLSFSGLVNDDTIRVSFSIDPLATPYEDHLQLVTVIPNGEMQEIRANFFTKYVVPAVT